MKQYDDQDALIARAAEAVAKADAIVIGAGAGMGVDSGLPDFRGAEGFWRAYPIAKRLGLSFAEMASPRWFREDPSFAWGFYGHRRNLYRATTPHEGHGILRRWMERMPNGGFVFSSNVDAHFLRSGFPTDRLVECHGSIERMQCMAGCGAGVFDAEPGALSIDMDTLRAADPLPRCPRCGVLARPNILMFGDGDWDSSRTDAQASRFEVWLRNLSDDDEGSSVVIVECGAGTAIPTVRHVCERIARLLRGTLLRINVREHEVPSNQIGMPMPAMEALEAIDRRIGNG